MPDERELRRTLVEEGLRLTHDEFVLFGHTHRPVLDEDRRLANAGAWTARGTDAEHVRNYLEIRDGEVELVDFV